MKLDWKAGILSILNQIALGTKLGIRLTVAIIFMWSCNIIIGAAGVKIVLPLHLTIEYKRAPVAPQPEPAPPADEYYVHGPL